MRKKNRNIKICTISALSQFNAQKPRFTIQFGTGYYGTKKYNRGNFKTDTKRILKEY